jgi:hypothetical protein
VRAAVQPGRETGSPGGKGQTAFTCAPVSPAGGEGFSDAHCDKAVSTGATFKYMPSTERTQTTFTNGKTRNDTTEAEAAVMPAATLPGIGDILFTGCTTNVGGHPHQRSCQGAWRRNCRRHGIELELVATNYATITFIGASCGLRLFPNIRQGTAIATANGEPNGRDANREVRPGTDAGRWLGQHDDR